MAAKMASTLSWKTWFPVNFSKCSISGIIMMHEIWETERISYTFLALTLPQNILSSPSLAGFGVKSRGKKISCALCRLWSVCLSRNSPCTMEHFLPKLEHRVIRLTRGSATNCFSPVLLPSPHQLHFRFFQNYYLFILFIFCTIRFRKLKLCK